MRSTGRRPGSGARAAGWLLLAVWLLTGSVALAAEDGAKAGAAEGLSVTSFGRETVYLSLDDVWALADAHHPAVRDARREEAALERSLEQREAAYAPSLALRAEGLGVRVAPDGSMDPFDPGVGVSAGIKLPSGWQVNASLTALQRGLGTEAPESSVRGTVTLSYPLFRSAELDADALALREAAVALEAGRRSLERARQEARAQVLAALRDTEVAAARLRLAQAGHEEAVRHQRIVQAQAEAGIATEAQQLAAQLELLRAEQELVVAERTYQAREAQLLRFLGLNPGEVRYEFESVWDWLAMPPPGVRDELVERAVAASADVWERRQAVEAARLQLEAERERSGWDTSVQVSYTTQGVQDQNRRPGWQVGLQASYPLYDGGQRRLSVAGREEAYVRAEEALAAAKEQVEAQVADLLFQLEDARRQVEIARLEVTRAELEWATARRQLELPVPAATADTVAAARRAVERADIAWREAVWAYQARWIDLQILLGRVDWDALRGEE